MSIKIIASTNVPEAIGPYSIGIKYGNIVFTSGQLGIDPKTGEMAEGIEAQTRQALSNVKTILEVSESSMNKVLKTTVFLSDISNFGKMNDVYSTFFSGNYPARSAVEVARLPKDALVEIEVVAYSE